MPKIVDHEHYRQELLSQCLPVIAEKGYATISMRQIAQGLGVSTGTLYHYFPSKEILFEQLVEYISYQDTSEEVIAELLSLPKLSDRIEAMFKLVAANEEYFLHQTMMLVDFGRQQSRAVINHHETLRRAGERYEKAILRVLEIEDATVAVGIISMMDGLLIRRLYQGDRISFATHAALFKDLLMAYLDRPKTATH